MTAPRAYQDAQFEHDPRWTQVDEYAIQHLNQKNAHRENLLHAKNLSDKGGLPNIEVGTLQGDFLAIQCILMHAKNVLEVGTLGGYSAICMAGTSPETKVVSVEIDPHHKEVAEEAIKHAGLEKQVEVILGAGLDVLPKLRKEVADGTRPKFDIVFIDADKINNFNYYNESIQMCRSGALIMVDNVVRKGRLADAEAAKTDDYIKGSRRVVEGVGKDDRVLHSALLQTVGEKNYDGFLMCVVK